MIRNNILFTLIILITLSVSCTKVEKNVQDYFPKVETKSIEVLPDGSVKVVGELLSEGRTELYYAGFCMDTLPNPKISLNQILVDQIDGNTFTAIYKPSFDKQKTYYFRAWVANESWYDVGDDIVLKDIAFNPAIIPCNPPQDSMILKTEFYTKKERFKTKYNITGYPYTVRVNTGIRTFVIEFNSKPISGVYTTTENLSGYDYTAIVTLDGYKADNKVSFYVEQIDATTIEIVFCEMKMYDGNLPCIVDARFRVSY